MAIAFKASAGQRLERGAQATAFAVRLIPDLFDEALMALDAELNDDIDQEVQELLDVGARQFLATAALLDEEHELLEGELGAGGVHARDRTRVAGVGIAQVIEGLVGP